MQILNLPCSLDLAPSGKYLFSKMKKKLSCHYFDSDDAVIAVVDHSQKVEDANLYKGICVLQHRWTKCVNVGVRNTCAWFL